MTSSDPPSPQRLNVTSLSQYIRLENCDRYLRFRLRPADDRRLRNKWNITLQPLTPLLKESGFEFERKAAKAIAARGEQVVNLEGQGVEVTEQWLKRADKPVVLLQASVEAPLGRY